MLSERPLCCASNSWRAFSRSNSFCCNSRLFLSSSIRCRSSCACCFAIAACGSDLTALLRLKFLARLFQIQLFLLQLETFSLQLDPLPLQLRLLFRNRRLRIRSDRFAAPQIPGAPFPDPTLSAATRDFFSPARSVAAPAALAVSQSPLADPI